MLPQYFGTQLIDLSQVHKFGSHLPASLLRLLISKQVFKVGSSIKADFTRLKKQFPQLSQQKSFNVIELKEYCVRRGIIPRKGSSGALDVLAEKLLGVYLSKDDHLRRSEQWEAQELSADHIRYAALDVYASHLIFEKALEVTPLALIGDSTQVTPGTRVQLLVYDGSAVAAYGKVADVQPTSLGHVRVKVPTNSRLVIDVDQVVLPAAAAILHLLPGKKQGKAKAGTYTLGQLHSAASGSGGFQMVALVSHLQLDPDYKYKELVNESHCRYIFTLIYFTGQHVYTGI
jgi:hypothetical protein